MTQTQIINTLSIIVAASYECTKYERLRASTIKIYTGKRFWKHVKAIISFLAGL